MDELRAGLGERENGEELLRILQAADTDGNGSINYTGEYQISVSFLESIVATMDARTFLKESYLKTAFKMFDTDGSVKIDTKELDALLSGEAVRAGGSRCRRGMRIRGRGGSCGEAQPGVAVVLHARRKQRAFLSSPRRLRQCRRGRGGCGAA